MIRPFDARAVARLLTGHELNGELAMVSDGFRPAIDYLAALPVEDRLTGWNGVLCLRPDREAVQAAVEGIDPESATPEEEEAGERFATVADIRRGLSDTPWTWENWIPSGGIFGLAGCEGTGKTRSMMDLHRRAWHGLPAPDGQAFAVAPGRPAMWLCSDGNHDELARLLTEFGLPDESVVFPALASDPYLGTDLDDPELIGPDGMLERAIAAVKPWVVVVDTLTSATARNLCDQHVMKGLKAPLVRLAQIYGVSFGLLLHLSREGQVLGRRIKGLTRVLMHVECPDPDHSERLKFWVEKTFDRKPPPLGLTLGADGNTYDFTPPAASAKSQGGRPPEKLDKATAFLTEKLSARDRKQCELIEEWVALKGSKGTIFDAIRAMQASGQIVIDDSVKPKVCHLIAAPMGGQEPVSDYF